MSEQKKMVILLSGGMDSSTLFAYYLEQGYDVYGLGVRYGQRHAKELTSALAIAEHYYRPFTTVDLTSIKEIMPSAQTQKHVPIPEGSYTEEVMKATVSPNRNMIMLSVAVAYAISIGAECVAYAAHAGDHTIYPDCRPEFIVRMRGAIKLCHFEPIHLRCPFAYKTKAEILAEGIDLHVPYELTWSCYNGRSWACGRCGTCVERLEAFHKNNIEDPLLYEDRTFWKEALKNAQI